MRRSPRRHSQGRKNAHVWESGFWYSHVGLASQTQGIMSRLPLRTGYWVPREHNIPFEIAQDKLCSAWKCTKCGTVFCGNRPPSKYLRVHVLSSTMPAPAGLLCDDLVTHDVMES